jgi:hypothetical protein
MEAIPIFAILPSPLRTLIHRKSFGVNQIVFVAVGDVLSTARAKGAGKGLKNFVGGDTPLGIATEINQIFTNVALKIRSGVTQYALRE